MRLFGFALALLVLAPIASAGEFPLTVHERTLDNGLKILVIPRKGVPTSPCAIAYRVGSVNERVGQTGMAHYLEHMMFKGTEKTGVEDLALDAKLRTALDRVVAETIRVEDGPRTAEAEARLKALREERLRLIEEQKRNLVINHLFTIYREAGSTFTNAMTSHDMTIYIAALPPEKLELFFWVEADRMRNIVFRQFHAEKDVVREERRMYENRPGAGFSEEMSRALFGSHPYAHPVLGYHDDLRRMTRRELRSFWARHYTPDNAVIYVGGDVDPEEVFALAEKYFGLLPPSDGRRPRIPDLRITGNGEIRMNGEGKGESSVEILWRAPSARSDEALALSFLGAHLGDSEGDLVKDLVERRKLALSVRAGYDARKHGGVVSVEARLAPETSREEVEARILEAVAELREEVLSPEAMDDLRRRYRARILGSVRRDMRVGFLILRRELLGSWRDIDRDLVRARTLDAEEIREVAHKYLTKGNRLVAHYRKKEETGAYAGPTADTPPPPDTRLPASWKDLEYRERSFTLPSAAKHRRVLGNGIRAFVVPNVGDPVIRVSAQVHGGSAEDPVGKEGLHDLAVATLGEAGIPGLDAKALRAHLEGMVASVSTSSGLTAHSVTVSVFPSDLEEGLRVLRLLLAEPQLDPEAFERIRARRVAALEAAENRLAGVAGRLDGELLWGDVPETRRATLESLRAITLADVRRRLEEVTGPERIVLAVSGDVDADAMTARLEKALGSFVPDGVRPYAPPTARNDPAAAARGLHVKHMPTSQGAVRIGTLTVPSGHDDAPALRVLSTILARRIFNQVRSVHGLSYTATARWRPSWRNDSRFTVVFQTKCPSVPFAVRLAKEEIAKLIEEGPTDAELEETKKTLDAGFRRTFGTGFAAAEVFAGLEGRGIDLTHHEKLRKAYAAVTAERLREVGKRYLSPERLLILCVGDVEAMSGGDGVHPDRLDLGTATVHGETAAAATGAASLTPEAVVERIVEGLEAGRLQALRDHGSRELIEKLDATPDAGAQLKMLSRMLTRASSTSIAIVPETSNGETAEVRMDVELERQGQKRRFVLGFRMVKESGVWKCESFGGRR
jgi:predicted Zn-dependent peptidase